MAQRGSVVVYARPRGWLPPDPDDPRLADLLGPDWERYQQMSHPQVRGRFVASRLLLKYAACSVIHASPRSVELAYKPSGRPYLRGLDQIDISLSHTEGLLLVGLTRRGMIGVDAELENRQMIGAGVAKQVCTIAEQRMLDQVPADERNAALVRLWTLKEAYSKAIGQGLRFPFSQFGFGPGDRPVTVQRPNGMPGTGAEWTFGTHTVHDEYTVSVALQDSGFGDTDDTAAETMLDEGLMDALIETGVAA
jgi:4'-phosphopantetheinyl transferase